MSRDYLESVLKDIYKEEMDRSYKLDGAINLPTAVVIVLLGVGAFYMEHLPELDGRYRVYVFYVSMILFFISILGTMICLLWSYFRYYYRYLSPPKEIYDFDKGLREHYDANKYEVELPEGVTLDDQVKKEVRENLIEQFLESAAQNRDRNTQRTDWLQRSSYLLISSLLFLILSRGLFYTTTNQKPKPQDVRITEVPSNQQITVVLPAIQKVDVVGTPKVDVVGEPPVQKVQIVFPKKGDK